MSQSNTSSPSFFENLIKANKIVTQKSSPDRSIMKKSRFGVPLINQSKIDQKEDTVMQSDFKNFWNDDYSKFETARKWRLLMQAEATQLPNMSGHEQNTRKVKFTPEFDIQDS